MFALLALPRGRVSPRRMLAARRAEDESGAAARVLPLRIARGDDEPRRASGAPSAVLRGLCASA